MHTEEQAKALWCPMVRRDTGDGGASNRFIFDDCNCIASQCAMWRWEKLPERKFIRAENREALTVDESGGAVFSHNVPDPADFAFIPWDVENDPHEDPACWVETDESVLRRSTGYCGLAGKPGGAA